MALALIEVINSKAKPKDDSSSFQIDTGPLKPIVASKEGYGTYYFMQGTNAFERFLVWNYYRGHLYIREESLNVPLLGGSIFIDFGEDSIMECSIWEALSTNKSQSRQSPSYETIVLIATSRAVVQLTFHHPDQLRSGTDGVELSIFYGLESLCKEVCIVRRPRDIRAITCSSFWRENLNGMGSAYFVYALTNAKLYVVELFNDKTKTETNVQYELHNAGYMQKILSFASMSSNKDNYAPDCVTDLQLIQSSVDSRLYVITVCANYKLCIWCIESRTCVLQMNGPDVLGLSDNVPSGFNLPVSLLHHQLRVGEEHLFTDRPDRTSVSCSLLLYFRKPPSGVHGWLVFVTLHLDRLTSSSFIMGGSDNLVITTQFVRFVCTDDVLDFILPLQTILPEREMMPECIVLQNGTSEDGSMPVSTSLYVIPSSVNKLIPCHLKHSRRKLTTSQWHQLYILSLMPFSTWLFTASPFRREAIVETVLAKVKGSSRVDCNDDQFLIDQINQLIAQTVADVADEQVGGSGGVDVLPLLQSIHEQDTFLSQPMGLSILGEGKCYLLHHRDGSVALLRPMELLELSHYLATDNAEIHYFPADSHALLKACNQVMKHLDVIEPLWFEKFLFASHALKVFSSQHVSDISLDLFENGSLSGQESAMEFFLSVLQQFDLPKFLSSNESDYPQQQRPNKRARHGSQRHSSTIVPIHSPLALQWLLQTTKDHIEVRLRWICLLQCILMASQVPFVSRNPFEEHLVKLTELRFHHSLLHWMCSTPMGPAPARSFINMIMRTLMYTDLQLPFLNSQTVTEIPNYCSNFWRQSTGKSIGDGSVMHWFLWFSDSQQPTNQPEDESNDHHHHHHLHSNNSTSPFNVHWGFHFTERMLHVLQSTSPFLHNSLGRNILLRLCMSLLLCGKPHHVQELCVIIARENVEVPELYLCAFFANIFTRDYDLATNYLMKAEFFLHQNNIDLEIMRNILRIEMMLSINENEPDDAVRISLAGSLFSKCLRALTFLGEFDAAIQLAHLALDRFHKVKDSATANDNDYDYEGVGDGNGDNNGGQRSSFVYLSNEALMYLKKQEINLSNMIFKREFARGNYKAAFEALLSIENIGVQRDCLTEMVTSLNPKTELHNLLQISWDHLLPELIGILERKTICLSANSVAMSIRYHRILISLHMANAQYSYAARSCFLLVLSLARVLPTTISASSLPSSSPSSNVVNSASGKKQASVDCSFRDDELPSNLLANLQEQAKYLLICSQTMDFIPRTNDQQNRESFFVIHDQPVDLFGLANAIDSVTLSKDTFIAYQLGADTMYNNTLTAGDGASCVSAITGTATGSSNGYRTSRIINKRFVQLCYEWIMAKLVLLKFLPDDAGLQRSLANMQTHEIVQSLASLLLYHEGMRFCQQFRLPLDPLFDHLVNGLTSMNKSTAYVSVPEEQERQILLETITKLQPNRLFSHNLNCNDLRWKIIEHLLSVCDDDSVTGKAVAIVDKGHYHACVIRKLFGFYSGGSSVDYKPPQWMLDGLLRRNPRLLLKIYTRFNYWNEAVQLVCDWLDIIMGRPLLAPLALQESVTVTLLQVKEGGNNNNAAQLFVPHSDFTKLLLCLQHLHREFKQCLPLFSKLVMRMTEYQCALHEQSC